MAKKDKEVKKSKKEAAPEKEAPAKGKAKGKTEKSSKKSSSRARTYNIAVPHSGPAQIWGNVTKEGDEYVISVKRPRSSKFDDHVVHASDVIAAQLGEGGQLIVNNKHIANRINGASFDFSIEDAKSNSNGTITGKIGDADVIVYTDRLPEGVDGYYALADAE